VHSLSLLEWRVQVDQVRYIIYNCRRGGPFEVAHIISGGEPSVFRFLRAQEENRRRRRGAFEYYILCLSVNWILIEQQTNTRSPNVCRSR